MRLSNKVWITGRGSRTDAITLLITYRSALEPTFPLALHVTYVFACTMRRTLLGCLQIAVAGYALRRGRILENVIEVSFSFLDRSYEPVPAISRYCCTLRKT